MSCDTTYTIKCIALSYRRGDPKEWKAREIEGVELKNIDSEVRINVKKYYYGSGLMMYD